MPRWLAWLKAIGGIYAIPFRLPYGQSTDAVEKVMHRAGIAPWRIRGAKGEGLVLEVRRRDAFKAALVLAALSADFTPPPSGAAPRPSRAWGERVLREMRIPDRTKTMILDAYTAKKKHGRGGR